MKYESIEGKTMSDAVDGDDEITEASNLPAVETTFPTKRMEGIRSTTSRNNEASTSKSSKQLRTTTIAQLDEMSHTEA